MPARSPLASLAVLGALAALAGCGPSVVVESALQAPVPRVPTYLWRAAPQAAVAGERDALVDNDIVHRTAVAALDSAMADHGFIKAPDAKNADYLLSYHIGRHLDRERTVTSMPGPTLVCGRLSCWNSYRWGVYGAPVTTTSTTTYPEGTLLIDLLDRTNGQLVWRAIGEERLDVRDLTVARLRALADKMLDRLPMTRPVTQ
jgi:hypothetical protein